MRVRGRRDGPQPPPDLESVLPHGLGAKHSQEPMAMRPSDGRICLEDSRFFPTTDFVSLAFL